MKFSKTDYEYLYGKQFSNGYSFRLEGNPICSRTDKIIELVRNTFCLHVGCCDHIPLIPQKIRQGKWLHGLLEENCKTVLGVDINRDAVDYVNEQGFARSPVYYADVTADDFAERIPCRGEGMDFVLLGEILEHVDNPVSFLQLLCKNMRHIGFRGRYLITVPNAFAMMRGGAYANWAELINTDHRYWFTPYTAAKVLVSAGMIPEELWFVNYDNYAVEKEYQADQIIIMGAVETGEEQAYDQAEVRRKSAQLEKIIQEGKLEEALDYIEAMPQAERGDWQIQNLTGIVCSCCGQYKEAKTFFSAALAQQPDDMEICYNLADTCAALGERRQTEALLHRCEQTADAGMAEGIAALRKQLTEQKGGRVLMAAYYFPPLSGSGVYRSIKFAKYLPLFQWEPTVISTDKPPQGWDFADESQIAEIPENMEVIRIPDLISTGRETSLSAERVQALLGFLHDILCFSPEADKIYQQLAGGEEGILSLLTFPCSALSWAYDAVQYIEKNVDMDRFEVVYTTSGPSSAHLIGFYLRRKYGIPWVADYRDPWTFNPYGAGYDPSDPGQRLMFELESVLLQQADVNLTVADLFIPDYREKFGLPPEKILSITNGYDETDFVPLKIPQGRTDRFTINYSGLLYSNQRSIEPVLKAIRQLADEGKIELEKFRFRLVGVDATGGMEAAEKYGLKGIVDYTGYCPHQQALQANLDADLLLLLVGDEPRFKPVPTGKFFEYLRSGRPILALAPKDGFVDCTLRETGHGKVFLSTQIREIKEMVRREYQKWLHRKSAALLHAPAIEQFERKALTCQLAAVLENAARNTDLPKHAPMPCAPEKRYLVICNGGYPAEGNPRCMFAHERVLLYKKAGIDVEAFGFIWDAPSTEYEFEGVHVRQGGVPGLIKLLQGTDYAKILIHFIDVGVMYAIQEAGKLDMPMLIWCHGYEVLPWHRCWFNYTQEQIRQNGDALDQDNNEKRKFLKNIYAWENIQFIFVSEWQMLRSEKFIGRLPVHHQVIHNFINYEFFASPPKRPQDRVHILSIKNHASRTYGNDLTAKAILELSRRSCFPHLVFELYGDGILFEENFRELQRRNFPNVHIHRGFVSHEKMRELFRENGIFLSPSRMDSHQISLSEAMAAGMCVISSSAGPIREFLDESCGSIFEFDNYWMMAEDIEYLYDHPDAFLRKSQNAVERLRSQCSRENTIEKEIALIAEV